MQTPSPSRELGLRDTIAATFGSATARAPGRCAASVDPGIPERVLCDPALVSAALSDLVENALILAERGPVTLTASVEWLGTDAAMLRLKTSMSERVAAEKWVPIAPP
jgi:hypothetical protein